MAGKRNFLITKKTLMQLFNISRPTINDRINKVNFPLTNPKDFLSWFFFEGMGFSRMEQWFRAYVLKRNDYKCSKCGSKENSLMLQFISKRPEHYFTFKYWVVICHVCLPPFYQLKKT